MKLAGEYRKLEADGSGPRFAALLCGCVVFAVTTWAVVDEAKSKALEAATPYVEMGYELREDSWGGQLKSGESKVVQHQLFRGNEYWFWGGTSTVECDVSIEIFDSVGTVVSLETFSADGKAGARVLPAKTGSYLIQVTVEAKGGIGKPDWALIYGYR
jgi:hypothetical protein